MVWNLPRFERLSGLLWCGKCDLGGGRKVSENRNSFSKKIMEKKTEEIIMPGGHLTVAQLTAMLNTIPLEITFVDEDNINRFFNEGE